MSHTATTATIEAPPATRLKRRSVARRRSSFYVGISGALLLIVFIGFFRTLYFRVFLNVPEIPLSLIAHGVVLTAWFVGIFVQAVLVKTRRIDIHRRLGWFFVAVGMAVVLISLFVTLNFVPRLRSIGVDIEAALANASSVVWTDFVALVVFLTFLSLAVALRRRPEVHKRLMVLASISILSPAIARMWGMVGIRGPERDLYSLGSLVVLLAALALFDQIATKRIHFVTLLGATFFIGLRIFAVFVVARSEIGRAFVRGL
jgi:hypothetical protein